MGTDWLPASAAGGVFSREKTASWRRFAAWQVRELAAGMSSHADTEARGSFACFGTRPAHCVGAPAAPLQNAIYAASSTLILSRQEDPVVS